MKTDVEEKLECALALHKKLIDHRKRLSEGLENILKEIQEFEEVWKDSIRTVNQYRILNDIRTGKLKAIVASSGKEANITFS